MILFVLEKLLPIQSGLNRLNHFTELVMLPFNYY